MPRTKTVYPEIQEIRDDLDSLKTNVVELARHIQANGGEYTQELVDETKKRLGTLKNNGKKEIQKVERQIKANPAQSMAAAFAVGALASLLFGRRRG